MHGLRLVEAGLLPPSEDATWLDPLIGRWATLVMQVCGIEPPYLGESDGVQCTLDEVAATGEWSQTSDAAWCDPSDDEAVPECTHGHAAENWIWELQAAAIEGAYHLSEIRGFSSWSLDHDGHELDDERDDHPVQLMPSTHTWHEALHPHDWECAPGVVPAPALDDVGVEWLGYVVFEIGRRTGVRSLGDYVIALEAARRALQYVAVERLVSPDDFYPWGEANESLTDADFSDWPEG